MLKNDLAALFSDTLHEVKDEDLALLVLRCRIEVMSGNSAAHAWACAFEIEQRKRYRSFATHKPASTMVQATKT